jgi:hemerythrin
MNTYIWNAKYETGVLSLDMDHRLLFALGNQVIAAEVTGDTVAQKTALLTLVSTAVSHVDRSDRLMLEIKYDYPKAARHQLEHARLLKKLMSAIDDLDAGKETPRAIGEMLLAWLMDHIVVEDKPLGVALLQQQNSVDRRTDPPAEFEEDELLGGFRRIGNLEPIMWSEKFKVGLPEIDQDHRMMIEAINQIFLVRDSADRDHLATLIESLGNMTVAHFEHEEASMRCLTASEAELHRREHRDLLEEFGLQADEWRWHRISTETICRFMRSWLLRHIISQDVHLGKSAIATR